MKKILISIFIFWSLFFTAFSAQAKFINTFLIRIEGAFTSGDQNTLAKYDVMLGTKPQHNDIGGGNGSTWAAIHALNGTAGYADYTEIYLYEMAWMSDSERDTYDTIYCNSVTRYDRTVGTWWGQTDPDTDRYIAAGDITNDNPTHQLAKSVGYLTFDDYHPHGFVLDFGDSTVQSWVIQALTDDFSGRVWEADGIYSDHCEINDSAADANGTSTKYSTDALWAAAMENGLDALTAGLHASGIKFAGNRGGTKEDPGPASWAALDAKDNPPDAVLEEGTFVGLWCDGCGAFFIPEDKWVNSVDTLNATRNSKVLYASHINSGSTSGSATDNYGRTVTFWDALWYAMSSFLIGKNDVDDNSYFYMRYTTNYTPFDMYFDEYDLIDLGAAVGGYTYASYSGHNIYWREFADGYVYVNPTQSNVTNIPLPQACKQRTHANLSDPLSSIENVTTIDLNSNRAAILYKTSETVPPTGKIFFNGSFSIR